MPLVYQQWLKVERSGIINVLYKNDLQLLRQEIQETDIKFLRDEDGLMLIHHAMFVGNIEILKYIIECGVDVNATARTTDMWNLTALHMATELKEFEICRLLLDAGADVDVHICTRSGGMSERYGAATALHTAVYGAELEIVRLLVKRGFCINAQMTTQRTPLMLAAMMNCADITQYLIDEGALINMLSTARMSVLHLCAENLQGGDVCKILLKSDVDLNCFNKNGYTPLHCAVVCKNFEVTSQLLEVGASVNDRVSQGYLEKDYTTLHLCVLSPSSEILQLLLQKSAKIDDVCTINQVSNTTALHVASEKGYFNLAKILADNGAHINCQDGKGNTPLHYALILKRPALFHFLFNHPDIDVNIQNKEGLTPLMFGMEMLRIKPRIKQMIESGKCDLEKKGQVNVTELSQRNVTALHLSIMHKSYQYTEMLIAHGADLDAKMFYTLESDDPDEGSESGEASPLSMAVMREASLKLVMKLIDSGARIHEKAFGCSDYSLMHGAICRGHMNIIKYLISKGVDVNANNQVAGKTVLMYAVHASTKGNREVVDLLIEAGVHLDAQDFMEYTSLHWAIQSANEQAARTLIDAGANLNLCSGQVKHRSRLTPLILALEYCPSVVEKLLEKGADPNAEYNSTNITPLHLVAELGSMALMKTLVSYGACVNTQSITGESPLHLSLLYKNTEEAHFLMKCGADVNSKARMGHDDGQSPLHIASHIGLVKTAKLLIEFGADMNAVMTLSGVKKLTPLHLAAINDNTDIVELLLDNGGDANLIRDDSFTSLMTVVSKSNARAMGSLLSAGANPLVTIDVHRSKDSTALHLAAQNGSVEICKRLLKEGVDVNCKMTTSTRKGIFPLFLAAENGHGDVVDLLLEMGTGINAQEACGLSALHYAALNNQPTIVQQLIQLGINVNLTGNYDERYNMTALHAAAENGFTKVVSELLEGEANVNAKAKRYSRNGITPLYMAVIGNHIATVEDLLLFDCDPEIPDEDGVAPLHIACQKGFYEIFGLLLSAACNINVKATQASDSSVTPLHLVCEKGHTEMVRALLAAGCDVNATCNICDKFTKKTSHNITALHQACGFGHSDIVKMLLQAGADCNMTETFEGRKGITPFLCAAIRGRSSLLSILLSCGIDIDYQDSEGYTALHWTVQEGYIDASKKLMDLGINPLIRAKDGRLASSFLRTSDEELSSALLKYEMVWRHNVKDEETYEDRKYVRKERKKLNDPLIHAQKGVNTPDLV